MMRRRLLLAAVRCDQLVELAGNVGLKVAC